MTISKTISIVSPVYKAEKILPKLIYELQIELNKLDVSYEIILVDDRSPDSSWQIMKEFSKIFNEVKSIRLTRNFGQHPAIMAGLVYTTGQWIVVMDCDLQDQPKEIVKLYEKALEGYDIVLARRERRQDKLLKKVYSVIFSKVYSYLTDTKFDGSTANFGIYSNQVIREVLSMKDSIKSFPLFIKWVGFKTAIVNVEHANRFSGRSSYNFSKLVSLAFNTIISFSNKPLKLFVKFGLFISLFSFLFGVITIYRFLNGHIAVLGYSSIIVSIWFLFGILITVVGIVGIYVGKIFDQTKGRKSFIIEKIVDYES